MAAASQTRLLVLGVVRIFQPVHGYFVRRELMSWRADDWAHLNPGSIYNALASLTRDGFLEQFDADSGVAASRTPRLVYRLTADGETEFLDLLRRTLWTFEPYQQNNMFAALSFCWTLAREEVVAALEHRVTKIEAHLSQMEFTIADLGRDPGKPEFVAEHIRLAEAWLRGELPWARDLARRLREGAYWFAGEPNPPWHEGEASARVASTSPD
jgi:DNA-binding PadR family transcriptional regulator